MEASTANNILENEAVMVETAKNDDACFEILYNHYFPRIYGFVFKRTGNREEAEDIVSKTFMKAFCALGDYNTKKGGFSSWLYTIANNNLIDYYRKQGRKREVDIKSVSHVSDDADSPERQAVSRQQAELVRLAIKDLKVKHQKILQLKFFAELDNKEIAEVMGITSNNAGVLLHRALKKFALVYKNYENSEK